MLELQQRKKALAAGIYVAGDNTAAARDGADIERPSSRRSAESPIITLPG